MKIVIIIVLVVFAILLNGMDERLMWIETYLREIKDLLHEIKNNK